MEDNRSVHLRRALQHAIFGMITCALVESLSAEEINRSELRQVMAECYAVISQAGAMQSSRMTKKESARRAKELWTQIRQVIDEDWVDSDAVANLRDFQTARTALQTAKDELALVLG